MPFPSVGQEYNGELVGCVLLVFCSAVGWISAVCIAEDEVATGLRFCMGAGVEEVEVKTLGDVGTLVTSAGVRNQHESKD